MLSEAEVEYQLIEKNENIAKRSFLYFVRFRSGLNIHNSKLHEVLIIDTLAKAYKLIALRYVRMKIQN